MVSTEKQPNSEPPRSPDFERRLELYNYQYIAIPLLLLIPILALFGVFGETSTTSAASADGLSLEVAYPDRVHAGMGNEITFKVTNESGADLPLLEVMFDQDYLQKFVNVAFMPEVSYLTDTYAVVEFENVLAGETRVITLELQGLWIGSHTANITARAGDGQGVSATISTFVFP